MDRRERKLSRTTLWGNIGYLIPDPDCKVTTGHEDEEQKVKQVCINDMLPDELLLLIFSYLQPLDLVGAVPEVCQRWNMLSRLKAAWRSAKLVYPVYWPYLEDPYLRHKSFLRVARRAPFLDVLDISRLVKRVGRQEIRQVFSTLLEANCEVRSLVLKDVRHRALKLLLKLLIKYAPTLKSLCLQMDNKLGTFTARCTDHRKLSILTCIRDMPQLSSFNMMDSFLLPESYDGQFLQGFRALQNVQWSSNSKSVQPAILDILKNCRERLTAVSWTSPPEFCRLDISDDYKEILRNCVNLQQVQVPPTCIEIITNLPYLEKLTLDLGWWDSTYEEMLCLSLSLIKFIYNAKVIPTLREIRLAGPYPFSCWRRNTLARYVAETVIRRCGANSNLRVLHLSVHLTGTVLTRLFRKMPQLEKLHFVWNEGLTLADLKLIGMLTNLKFLQIDNFSV